MSNDNKNSNDGFMKAFAHLSQIGISIIGCIVVGILLGWLLDRWLGTSPWLIIVFTLLGIAAAFKSIFEFAKKM